MPEAARHLEAHPDNRANLCTGSGEAARGVYGGREQEEGQEGDRPPKALSDGGQADNLQPHNRTQRPQRSCQPGTPSSQQSHHHPRRHRIPTLYPGKHHCHQQPRLYGCSSILEHHLRTILGHPRGSPT